MKRVADGKASGKDMFEAMSRISAAEIAKNRGIRVAARKKVAQDEARKKRILEGKATTLDLLRHIGTSRLSDIGPLDR